MTNLLKRWTSEPRAYRYVGHILFASALFAALRTLPLPPFSG